MVSTASARLVSMSSSTFPSRHRWLNFPWSASSVRYTAHQFLDKRYKTIRGELLVITGKMYNCSQWYLVDGGACSSLDWHNEGLILSGSHQERCRDLGGAGKGRKRRH